MPENPSEALSLPPGVSRALAETVIRKYAPLLRLHATEAHLPSSPELFREDCRFRFSRAGRDYGWSKTRRKWYKYIRNTRTQHNVPWNDILGESKSLLLARGVRDPALSVNLRPRDNANMFGKNSPTGLFLQRHHALSDDASGIRPTPSGTITAPVFVDTAYNSEYRLFRVLYWFFYELNHWHFMITHEGDWEHISVMFRENDFKQGRPPRWVYFAQHNHGELRGFLGLRRIEDTHPVIYVDKNGHPCRANVKNPDEYVRQWRTWETKLVFITEMNWRDYAGAWGEVGESMHTTGPLGPYFKRYNDNLVFKKVRGKTYVVLNR